MSGDIETAVRGPEAYSLARRVLEDMERRQIWPTPLNYELWLHFMADPSGALGREIERRLAQGEAITEGLVEELAALYLPKAKLNDQIRDAGAQLNRELAAVAQAIKQAQTSNEKYGETLANAGQELTADVKPSTLKDLVQSLASATRRVQQETKALEKRLEDSSAEVGRLREHLEQVRRDATTDALTSLANRKAFDDELARACAEAAETGQALSLALVDIDLFKRFNDNWGHQTGDQVLRYVANVIGRIGAPPRFAARFGGEEFAMIFPSERVQDVLPLVEEIRLEVSSRTLKRRSTNEDLGAITVSAGIAEFQAGDDVHALVERVDEALYASKHAGRNRTTTAGGASLAA